jgi:hypothetical protein
LHSRELQCSRELLKVLQAHDIHTAEGDTLGGGDVQLAAVVYRAALQYHDLLGMHCRRMTHGDTLLGKSHSMIVGMNECRQQALLHYSCEWIVSYK